jgi:hypothetical protein
MEHSPRRNILMLYLLCSKGTLYEFLYLAHPPRLRNILLYFACIHSWRANSMWIHLVFDLV